MSLEELFELKRCTLFIFKGNFSKTFKSCIVLYMVALLKIQLKRVLFSEHYSNAISSYS